MIPAVNLSELQNQAERNGGQEQNNEADRQILSKAFRQSAAEKTFGADAHHQAEREVCHIEEGSGIPEQVEDRYVIKQPSQMSVVAECQLNGQQHQAEPEEIAAANGLDQSQRRQQAAGDREEDILEGEIVGVPFRGAFQPSKKIGQKESPQKPRLVATGHIPIGEIAADGKVPELIGGNDLHHCQSRSNTSDRKKSVDPPRPEFGAKWTEAGLVSKIKEKQQSQVSRVLPVSGKNLDAENESGCDREKDLALEQAPACQQENQRVPSNALDGGNVLCMSHHGSAEEEQNRTEERRHSVLDKASG